MRLNKFVAQATGMSRRAADATIEQGAVIVDGEVASIGTTIADDARVTMNGMELKLAEAQTILFNKPAGYVCSRDGQGSRTIYDLLPSQLHALKPIGRLDKNSSGLLLLTNDGDLAHELTHPSKQKIKVYEVVLDKDLAPLHRQMISDIGISLEDGISKLQIERQNEGDDKSWKVTMHEGRNRQIRRTFAGLGYEVRRLHRIQFGNHTLNDLPEGKTKNL